MFDLLFLGTSASAPSVRRGLPSQLLTYNEHRFLIDCGEGTQRQLLTAGAGFKKINKILITHNHLDHILGLAGLLSTLMRWETLEEMHIYAGADAVERIRDLLYTVVLRNNHTVAPLIFHTLESGVFFEEGNLSVSCFPVIHRGTNSFGFRFQEKGKRPFLNDQAEALGVPVGPMRRALVNEESVTLEDGTRITPDQVLGDYIAGTQLSIVGDTGNTQTLVEPIKGSDALVIEATYLEEEKDMASKFSHLTARMAASLARDTGVRTLYLTHVSRRYREKDILAEAQSEFPNTIVARDLSQFEIKKQLQESRD